MAVVSPQKSGCSVASSSNLPDGLKAMDSLPLSLVFPL